MNLRTSTGRRLQLRKLQVRPARQLMNAPVAMSVRGSEYGGRYSELMSVATRAHFELREAPELAPAAYQDEDEHLRVVYKEVVIRFKKRTAARVRDNILKKHGFEIRSRNRYAPNQYVVHDPANKIIAEGLAEVSNSWSEMDEVLFASPNFVSEYARVTVPTVHSEQWHLRNRGTHAGQIAGEDVGARDAWQHTTGEPRIAVAVLDDGVDVGHPVLRYRILRRPDPDDPNDIYGRDFFVAETSPDHYDPRPKVFTYPYHRMNGNDIHGTPCAGVIAGNGKVHDVIGIAPRCRVLPVKIFHADSLASDARVANAIRYAARFADVISCSWSAGFSDDILYAIQDASQERRGRGVAVFCAAGNSNPPRPVSFPARMDETIAVGASTDEGRIAGYSNRGPEVSVCAPSSGGVRGILTADVSYENRGFNTGDSGAGGEDGLYTNDFGGTSSATPLAAGVAALMLSANPDLSADAVRQILQDTATKIGSGYVDGYSPEYGYGRIDAAAAVEAAHEVA